MSRFEEKDFLKLTKLCRIDCTEEEKKKLLHSLQDILAYIDQLKEVDTEGVNPCNHVIETINNVMREDVVGELLSRELFLANAPAHVGGMIRVPPVIKNSNP
jgi:aspartyl-tRNA(Asn)/glutamyl-tRNA(Gln) amidotransferase subunit C